jgi:hypothetical protein
MSDCYDKRIIFTDPAFATLPDTAVKMMWQMLIERSKGNLNIHFDYVIDDGQ